MNKWDARFLSLAQFISTWSKDPSTKVGAVIANGNRIISIGFNGPAHGLIDDPNAPRELKLARTVHAEVNAILFAKQDLRDCTLYCTHPPCAACAALIIQSGITHTVEFSPNSIFWQRWREDIKLSDQILHEAGIKREMYEISEVLHSADTSAQPPDQTASETHPPDS